MTLARYPCDFLKVEDLSEADKRMKVATANQIINSLSSQGEVDLQANDFQGALEFLNKIIALKNAGNNRDIPANLDLKIGGLLSFRKSIMEAMQ